MQEMSLAMFHESSRVVPCAKGVSVLVPSVADDINVGLLDEVGGMDDLEDNEEPLELIVRNNQESNSGFADSPDEDYDLESFNPSSLLSVDIVEDKSKKAKRELRKIHSGRMKKSLYKCSACGKSYPTSENLRIHKRIHKRVKKYVCDRCPARFIAETHLIEHIRTHTGEKPYNCEFCEKTFAHSGSRNRHVLTHNLDGGKAITCEICGLAFVRRETLKRHLSITHAENRPYICEFCQDTFPRPYDLKKHIISSHQEKPFKCQYCGQAFRRKYDVRQHQFIHNEEERPYRCELCNRAYGRKIDLTRHIPIHSGGKLYNCEFCVKGFARRSTYNKHVTKFHTSELETNGNHDLHEALLSLNSGDTSLTDIGDNVQKSLFLANVSTDLTNPEK